MLQNYFEKFGHHCKLNLNSEFDIFFKEKSWICKWFLKNSIISQKYILKRSHVRSYAALRNEIFRQLDNYPLSIHPFSTITFYWDVLMLFVICSWLVMSPFNFFLYLKPMVGDWIYKPKVYEHIFAVICLLDIVRRFFTGYIIYHSDSEEIVLDIHRIVSKYFRCFFFIDLFSSLPTFIQAAEEISQNVSLLFEMFSLLKLFRLFTVTRTAEVFFCFFRFNYNLTDILTSIIFLLVFVHWLSCFSIVLGIFQRVFNPDALQWYNYANITDLSRPSQYNICLHRTLSLLTGTGFKFKMGDPVSENDMIYTIFTVGFGWILSFIIFAKTYEKLIGMRSSSAKYEEMLSDISHYMAHKRLPPSTQTNIKQYYAYKYEHSFFKEHKILSATPTILRQDILVHYSKLLIESIPFFRLLPKRILVKIVSHLATEIVVPGDVIYRINEIDDTMFFILHGTVALYTRSGREVQHLEDGAHFGSEAIIEDGMFHFTTSLAIETCEMFRLRSEDFFALVDYCPDLVDDFVSIGAARRELINITEERFQQILNKQLMMRPIEDEDAEN